MSTRAYSNELRIRVISWIKEGNTQASAVRFYKVSKSAVSRWWIRYKEESIETAKPKLGSKGRVDVGALESYVIANPDKSLVEIGREFNISNCAVHKRLKKLRFSYKKTFTYVEASEEKRRIYEEAIKDISPGSLVYIDESGIDMTICKDRGWGKKGKVLEGKKSGKYYQRTNIIAGLNLNKPIAPMVFNGSCNTKLFENWVEQFLIKELKPGQVVIMDNAAFHKSQKTKDLIESVKCKLIFLPPYSPDLNPIEKFWANMKRSIKDQISVFEELFVPLASFFHLPNSS